MVDSDVKAAVRDSSCRDTASASVLQLPQAFPGVRLYRSRCSRSFPGGIVSHATVPHLATVKLEKTWLPFLSVLLIQLLFSVVYYCYVAVLQTDNLNQFLGFIQML